MEGERPIPFVEMDAWARLSGIKLRPSHVYALTWLDREYLRRAEDDTPQEPVSLIKSLHKLKTAHDADRAPRPKPKIKKGSS